MRQLRITSLNAKNNLLNPELAKALLKTNPDIAYIAEATADRKQDYGRLEGIFAAYGYVGTAVRYKDSDNRPDHHVMTVLVRREYVDQVKGETIRLADSRNAVLIHVYGITIAGVHLDDRSGETRLKQANSLLDVARPDVIMGDLNETYPETRLGALLNNWFIRWLTSLFPVGVPGTKQSRIARINSLVTRLAQMTSGKVINTLRTAGYRNADQVERRPTIALHPRLPALAQLDHIFLGSSAVTYDEFRLTDIPATDHRALSAVITINP